MQLRDVLATELLSLRNASPRSDVATVLAPFEHLDAGSELAIWDAVSAQVLELCRAQSAGVSIFADARYDELTWVSTTGTLADFRQRRFPQRHSLCGVVFELRSTQLFVEPHRYFQWIAQAGVTIDEGLVVPLVSGERLYGTIWAMTHEPVHHFTAADEAMLAMLGDAATQYLAQHRAKAAEVAARAGSRPSRADVVSVLPGVAGLAGP